MKRGVFLALVVIAAVAVAVAIFTQRRPDVPTPAIEGVEGSERPSIGDLPPVIRQWVENSRPIFAGQSKDHDDTTYLLATRGERTTAADTIRIVDIRRDEDRTVVILRLDDPAGPAGQAVTYPYDLVSLPRVGTPIEFRGENDEPGYIPGVIGTDVVEPIVAQNRFIKIFEPASGAGISGGSLPIRGLANAFEGTVNFRLQRDGAVLDEGFATGAMGDWGYFESAIPLGMIGPGPAELVVFTYSAKDGSIVDPFSIEVELL